jgi:hypothetical protein
VYSWVVGNHNLTFLCDALPLVESPLISRDKRWVPPNHINRYYMPLLLISDNHHLAARHDSLLRINLRRSDYREGDKAGHGAHLA